MVWTSSLTEYIPKMNEPFESYSSIKSVEEFLEEVKKKFPRQGIRIEELYEQDSDFRSLCRDYFTCLQTLKKYKRLSDEEQQTVTDYQSALGDLEKELRAFIFP